MPNSGAGESGDCNTIYNTLSNTRQHSNNTSYRSGSELSDTDDQEETIDVEAGTI